MVTTGKAARRAGSVRPKLSGAGDADLCRATTSCCDLDVLLLSSWRSPVSDCRSCVCLDSNLCARDRASHHWPLPLVAAQQAQVLRGGHRSSGSRDNLQDNRGLAQNGCAAGCAAGSVTRPSVRAASSLEAARGHSPHFRVSGLLRQGCCGAFVTPK